MPSMILKVSSYLIMMSMSIQLIMPKLKQASVNAACSARDIGVSVNTKLFLCVNSSSDADVDAAASVVLFTLAACRACAQRHAHARANITLPV